MQFILMDKRNTFPKDTITKFGTMVRSFCDNNKSCTKKVSTIFGRVLSRFKDSYSSWIIIHASLSVFQFVWSAKTEKISSTLPSVNGKLTKPSSVNVKLNAFSFNRNWRVIVGGTMMQTSFHAHTKIYQEYWQCFLFYAK